jgi:hypothetical protein
MRDCCKACFLLLSESLRTQSFVYIYEPGNRRSKARRAMTLNQS